LRLAAGGFHQAHGFVHVCAQAVDGAGDLRGRRLGALRQAAHFIGDHGKAASLFTGASGFDGGVERQQVGLLGDATNGVDHQLNLLPCSLTRPSAAAVSFRRWLSC
jgi:hypothetical protein